MHPFKYTLLFSILWLSHSFVSAQTPAEKVALGFCKCAENMDYKTYVAILNSGSKNLIRSNIDSMEVLFRTTKRCARNTVVLTKEENRRVPEKEITAAMKANCPDVEFVHSEWRRISWEIRKEERAIEIENKFNQIERHVEGGETEAARTALDDFVSFHGSDEFGDRLIKNYYAIKDFAAGNNIARELLGTASAEYYISDDFEEEKEKWRKYLTGEFKSLALKNNQSKIVEEIDATLK